MKKFLVFILVLASKFSFSCGFYPFGEDVRFCFFNPSHFNYRGFSEFNYSANSFSYTYEGIYGENEITPNEKLWIKFCKNKITANDFNDFNANVFLEDINEKSTNKMILYFFETKNIEAIAYLKFLKRCEVFTLSPETDPWEKSENITLIAKQKLIDEGILTIKKVKNKELKSRYTFLIIRLAHYSGNKLLINQLFESEFKNTKNKNILYYWSLYFKVKAEKNKTYANFLATQVFVNATDKRFSVYQQYDKSVAIEKVLKFAKTNEEILNVKLFNSIIKSDKVLESMKEIYYLNPKSAGLSFLLLREVNKIEDWVLTPHYTLFEPSIRTDWYNTNKDFSVKKILNRVESDKEYAKNVINFIDNVDLKKVENPFFWKNAKAHLLFITRNFSKSLKTINELQQIIPKNDSTYNQLENIKALNLTANQSFGNAKILESVKPTILKNQFNDKFLFALGRELESLGNTTDAAFLYSNLKSKNYENLVFWKSKKNKKGCYQDYFSSYFGYVNVIYSPKQLENIIEETNKNNSKTDVFSIWKYNVIKNEIPKLYDLLGVKYIRQNNLQKAAENFDKIYGDYLITYYDCLWELKDCNKMIFDGNPFTQMINTPDFETKEKPFNLNKLSVTKKLIEYLDKANNPNEKNRDYYYFLAANCYYNMTKSGNFWMLRRFGFSYNDIEPLPEDESEFINGHLSKKYYLLAYKYSKSVKFKSLCLILGKNYKQLKSENEDDYFNLSGNCYVFNEYLQARI